jgi:hypothetical protein
VAAAILVKVLGVLGTQERALMMIEPPGEPRVGRILEIHDGIYIAVKETVPEQLGGPVRKPREFERCLGRELGFVKPAEERGGSGAVETMVVIQNSHPHGFLSIKVGKPSSFAQVRG